MKRFISLFLSILLFFCFYVNAFAYNSEDVTLHYAELVYRKGIVDEYDSSLEENTATDFAPFYQYGFNVGSYIYSAYSMLTTYEKLLYDSLVTNLQNGQLSVRIDFSPALSSADFSSIDWKNLLEAIVLDHPEFFYITSMSRSWATYSNGSVAYVILTVGSTSYYDKDVTLYTETEIQTCVAELDNAVKSVEVDLSNRYNFVKSLHDYLCNNLEYINNQLRCHDVYGALVEGEAVCQGYAGAFKLICDYYKIPCVCLTGTANGGAHMWNAVQMDDGYWYLLDATWDDQGSHGTYYDFFLVGLNSVDTYFGREAFSVSHVSDGSPYLPVLSYATEKYSETEHNTAFKATYNSIAKDNGKYLIRSFFDVSESYVYYNGMYVETENLATNGKFAVPSGADSANETWTLVLIGDCNGDGSSDALDYSDAVNKVLSDNGVTNAYDMAADVDCDGYLDVIDLAMLQLIINGLDTDIIIER